MTQQPAQPKNLLGRLGKEALALKTGLVTFYHIHHYGALLQAAATQRAVESLGGTCQIIDYYVNQNNDLFRAPTGLGSAAADAHTALHYKIGRASCRERV